MKRKRLRPKLPREVRSSKKNKATLGAPPDWPGEKSRVITRVGFSLIFICTVVVYMQTVSVPPIDYEDPFYLTNSPYVHVTAPFSRLDALWNEPYFANFHPVTTTTWLLDRALADKSQGFDGRPFRISHLLYAAIGVSLLIVLYRRLRIPKRVFCRCAVVASFRCSWRSFVDHARYWVALAWPKLRVLRRGSFRSLVRRSD
jgi:hypothetical protein